MDIQDAFTQEAIAAAGVDVGGPEEDELRELIATHVLAESSSDNPAQMLNACVLCFVAGRAFQFDQTVINVPMNPAMIGEFLSYLSEGGS